MTSSPSIEKGFFSRVLVPTLLLVFVYLFIRNSGIYPIVFIDEWNYAADSRLVPLSEAKVPSYLYFSLYKLTTYCGDSFLDCNRFLNTALFLLAAPFIYMLARRIASVWLSALVALAAVLSPNTAYTPFFMPEAMYFWAFWAYTWTVFLFYDRPTLGGAAGLGAVLGLMAMVKVHAIFLLPSLCVFLVYVAIDQRKTGSGHQWLRTALAMVGAALLAALATRMLIGYGLAGKPGLSLFGSLYGDQAAYTAQSRSTFSVLLILAWHNLQGHLISLAILFGVPLAALAGAVRLGQHSVERTLSVYTVLVLGSLLAVTVLFTASITGLADGDTAARIHTRYYNFSLPLLLLCGVALQTSAATLPRLWRVLLGLLVLTLIVYGRSHLLQSFKPTIIDSAEMRAFSRNMGSFNTMAALAALAVLLWIWRPLLGLRTFLYVTLPIATLYCAINTGKEVRQSIHADAYSKAGIFARHYLAPEQTNHLTVVGPAIGGLLRTRFFIENPAVTFMETPPDALSADWSALPAGTELVLAVGSFAPPDKARILAQMNGMVLFEAPDPDPNLHVLKFSRPLKSDYIAHSEGLAGPEPWGSWSVGPTVRITFAAPLPKRVLLRLTGHAYGPNAGKPVAVSLGDKSASLQWTEQNNQTDLTFETDGTAKVLQFNIPAPTSPVSRGQGSDERLLGIALERITIETLTEGITAD